MKTPYTWSDVEPRRKASRPLAVKLLARFFWLTCRIVANDLPSVRRPLEYEKKEAVRVASTSRCALQMKVSSHSSEAFVERLHLKPRKAEHAHLLLRGVGLAIALQHLGITSVHPRTDEENVRRVLVAGREGIHVPAIPVDDLLVQHSANSLSR